MAHWHEIEQAAPEFAAAVRARFDAYLHKTLATLRRDGSPRLSGTEATFFDGELWLGMMPGSMKARDLQRDPRLALHSVTVDVSMAAGDAKIAGRAVAVDDPGRLLRLSHDPPDSQITEAQREELAAQAHLFRIDIIEVVLTRIGAPADHLVIESWHPGRGIERLERK